LELVPFRATDPPIREQEQFCREENNYFTDDRISVSDREHEHQSQDYYDHHDPEYQKKACYDRPSDYSRSLAFVQQRRLAIWDTMNKRKKQGL